MTTSGQGEGVRERSIDVRGVRLRVLDWGGRGLPVFLLAGFGNTPHVFDRLARRLVGARRVFGLTRRGHGLSDHPEAGYDPATLAEDIVGVLDALEIPRAAFVGHSFAGCELIELGVAHSARVDRLVFLDALFELEDGDLERLAANPLRPTQPMPESFPSPEAYSREFTQRYPAYRGLRSPQWDAYLAHSLEREPGGRYRERLRPEAADQMGRARWAYRADWRAIRCPVLAVYAFPGDAWSVPDGAPPDVRDAVRSYTARMDHEYRERNIARARRDLSDVRVLTLRDASHFCFLDREDDVASAMRSFLSLNAT